MNGVLFTWTAAATAMKRQQEIRLAIFISEFRPVGVFINSWE